MRFKILVLDDEETALSTVKFVLGEVPDLEVITTSSVAEAIRLVRFEPYSYAVILLDLKMPEKDGATTAVELLKINPHLIIAINSGDYSREALKKCIASGVEDFIEKDTPPHEFREKVKGFCKKFEETAQIFTPPSPSENEKLIRSIAMVGQSKSLVRIAEVIHQAAPTDCNVLIYGESGTGKELVARAIHNLSLRRRETFIPINVGAIPENLLESDLFGHERGAFTGADKQKIGKFKLADGGTIFLDEIGDLKPDLQVKLLRVLQEGEFTTVGGNIPVKVNVRIVAATHVDLERAIAAGKFREDLFYRLNVLKITIPPLRDRPEDIRPLIAHFQKQFNGDEKKILTKTIRYLERYKWRGNVRELENEMEKLMTVVPANRIVPDHLSGKFFAEDATSSGLGEFDCTYDELISGFEDKERQYFIRQISKSNSLREAAKYRMRAPLTTIHGRMKKLGLTGGEGNEELKQ
ncbi:sigma-54 dependent transcriptional regulator [bacterium]|jgi:DNA-binding NtrC family response regulator|nr:sigma-54 dependent transcriptional regulator [bacterium]